MNIVLHDLGDVPPCEIFEMIELTFYFKFILVTPDSQIQRKINTEQIRKNNK